MTGGTGMSRRLIDADALERAMYEEAFEKDTDMQRWDSGCWIRYKLYERVLDAQPIVDIEPHWIPCSERLPEDDRSKVVTLANGNAEVGYYSNGDWWCVGDKVTLENPTVIAWMPLPKPYEVTE